MGRRAHFSNTVPQAPRGEAAHAHLCPCLVQLKTGSETVTATSLLIPSGDEGAGGGSSENGDLRSVTSPPQTSGAGGLVRKKSPILPSFPDFSRWLCPKIPS